MLATVTEKAKGTPLQYSCMENPMDRGAWWAAVHGVAKSRTRLSNFTFTFPFHALEKEMTTHSSVLAWRIPGTVERCRLPSMGSHRVRHDWSDWAAAAAATVKPCYLFYMKVYLMFNESVLHRKYVSIYRLACNEGTSIHSGAVKLFGRKVFGWK